MGREKERRNRSCPATKRDGEVCGAVIVSASGYCFAHDPEAAEWRAKGGRASGRKRRAAKRLREMGAGKLKADLEGDMAGLRSGEVSAEDLRALARATDTIFRMMRWAEEDEMKLEAEPRWPTRWEQYQV